jgi:hypothetical protein
MSNANATAFNGKSHRKTLAEQLDRLDAIIDALAAGLNETVADVVRQAVTAAVQQTLEGLAQATLNNPELLRRLAEQLAPPAAAAPQAAHEAGPSHPGAARHALTQAWSWLKGCKVWARRGWQAARRRLGLAWRFRGQFLAALGAGLAAGLLAVAAGPAVAAVLSGAGGVAAALLVMGGIAVRRMAHAAPVVPT